jgi:predicted methyltransferase MtxX (methanogen marker protein 4)
VEPSRISEPPQIGAPLENVRAAIDVVARGEATRITVHVGDAQRLIPAAKQLARRAGVRVELVEPMDPDSELTVVPLAASGR